MKKRTLFKSLGSLVLLYTIAFPQQVFAAENQDGAITIYTSYTRATGKPTDRNVAPHRNALIRAMLDHANIPYKYQYTPFARATDMLNRTPNSLFFAISRTPEREDKYVWIGRISTDAELDMYLYKLKTRTDINLTDLDSARPYTIGVGRADLFRQFFERHNFEHLAPTNKRSQRLEMLLAGRTDLLAHYSSDIITTCIQANVTTDLLSPALQLKDLTSGVYVVTSPNSDPKFIQKLTEAYRAKVADGTFNAMIDSLDATIKYFPAPK